jgi:hypothetical protein
MFGEVRHHCISAVDRPAHAITVCHGRATTRHSVSLPVHCEVSHRPPDGKLHIRVGYDAVFEAVDQSFMTKERDDPVKSWLDYRSMDRIERYVTRGRQLSELDDHELGRRWVVAFKTWVAKMPEQPNRSALLDFEAELSLRGKTPPYQLARDEFKVLIERSKQIFAGLSPEALERAAWQVSNDLKAFRQGNKKPSN